MHINLIDMNKILYLTFLDKKKKKFSSWNKTEDPYLQMPLYQSEENKQILQIKKIDINNIYITFWDNEWTLASFNDWNKLKKKNHINLKKTKKI